MKLRTTIETLLRQRVPVAPPPLRAWALAACLTVLAGAAAATLEVASMEDAALDNFLGSVNAQIVASEIQAMKNRPVDDTSHPYTQIFRFRYDVTGDGRDEVFFAVSSSDIVAEWSVYEVPVAGQPRLLGESLRMRPDNLSISLSQQGDKVISAYERLPDRDWGLVSYRFGRDGSVADQSRRLEETEKFYLRQGKRRAEFGLDVPLTVNAERAPLGAVAAGLRTQWWPYDISRSPADQAREPEIQQAATMLATMQPAPPASASAANAAANAFAPSPSPRIVQPSPGWLQEASAALGSTGWLVLAAGIALAVSVLGFLFLRQLKHQPPTP